MMRENTTLIFRFLVDPQTGNKRHRNACTEQTPYEPFSYNTLS